VYVRVNARRGAWMCVCARAWMSVCACVSQTRTHVEHEDIEGEAAAFVVVDDLEHVGGVEVEPVRTLVVQSDVCACVRCLPVRMGGMWDV
jgi:hypothetical protein